MSNKNADKVQSKFSVEHQYQEALGNLTPEELDSALDSIDE